LEKSNDPVSRIAKINMILLAEKSGN
jgi:hypothetical protein